MTAVDTTDHEKIDSRISPYALMPWVVIVLGDITDLFDAKIHPLWFGAIILPVFIALYLLAVWFGVRDAAGRSRPVILVVILLALTTPLMIIAFGGSGFGPLALLSIGMATGLPWRQAYVCIFALTVGSVAIALFWSIDNALAIGYTTLISGVVVTTMRRFLAAIGELRAAREELAQAAVEQERLRFARDLHDLLGQTLSLIVIKAELADRLGRDDPRGQEQVADIQRIGRDALREVREAVSGYRESSLAEEITRSAHALEAANIRPTITHEGSAPPPSAAAVVAWAVREAVTNVIRHSKATTCEITVRTGDRTVVLTVADNGRGAAAGPGNGLRA
ncbi:sensor histidine kinase [Fodinicola feengrottensis]|uniref:sensor histidine kinase n=1 Tax=Fodinicola feengrottensis TaxID=435914 RepID=UPI0013D0E9BC|nr:histidine kinase [Fodinicola feengrottensis]